MTEGAVNLTRRQFGKAAGALVVAFTLAPRFAGRAAARCRRTGRTSGWIRPRSRPALARVRDYLDNGRVVADP
jgi:hypothetical protein